MKELCVGLTFDGAPDHVYDEVVRVGWLPRIGARPARRRPGNERPPRMPTSRRRVVVTHDEPGALLRWKNRAGCPLRGRLEFHPVEGGRTRLFLFLSYDDEAAERLYGRPCVRLERSLLQDVHAFHAAFHRAEDHAKEAGGPPAVSPT